MEFLDSVSVDNSNKKVVVRYKSGYLSSDGDIAKFFMIMQDQKEDLNGVREYIKMARMIDQYHDWDEATKVVDSFSCQ